MLPHLCKFARRDSSLCCALDAAAYSIPVLLIEALILQRIRGVITLPLLALLVRTFVSRAAAAAALRVPSLLLYGCNLGLPWVSLLSLLHVSSA